MAKRKADTFEDEETNKKISISVASEILEKWYLNGNTADTYFLVKDDCGEVERIPAHKSLLTTASKAFHQMFYGKMKEAGDVTIVDATAAGFKEFLQCFYFNEIQLTFENVGEVMNLGEKYGIAQCVDACTPFLHRKLTTDNVCQVYQLAVLFKQSGLVKTCESIIAEYTKEVLESDGFLACDAPLLSRILDVDAFSCPETAVFAACMEWVKKASNQSDLTKEVVEEYLGEGLFKIRFRSMTANEFCSLMPSYGVLFSVLEYTDILQLIDNEEYEPKMFNGNRRKQDIQYEWITPALIRLPCHDGFSSSRYFLKSIESTTFTTNKPLLFGEIVCFIKPANGTCLTNYRVGVTVKRSQHQNKQSKMLYQGEIGIVAYKLHLPKPVLIRPDIDHEIELKLPDGTFYTEYRLKPEVQLKYNIVVRFSNVPMVDGQPRAVFQGIVFNPV